MPNHSTTRTPAHSFRLSQLARTRGRLVRATCLLTLLLGCSAGAGEQLSEEEEAAKVAEAKQTLKELHASHELPALWAARYDLVKGGEPMQKREFVYGVRKLSADPASQSAMFTDKVHLGSCTKAMTGLLIAQLVSTDPQFDWNTTLANALPEHESLQGSPWADIKIIDILHHRGGLPANAPWHIHEREFPDDVVAARAAVVDWLVKQKTPKKPTYLYSNTGYALLGHILESKSGESWEEIIAKRLFQPLGIQSAGFGPPTRPDTRGSDGGTSSDSSQPFGHHTQPGVASALMSLFSKKSAALAPVEIDNARPLGPAGRVHMRISDWAKFLQLFLHESAPEQIKGLKNADWQMLQDTGDDGTYAGGWIVTERGWAGGKALTHSGSNTTWHCVVWLAPKRDFLVLAVTNCHKEDAATALDSTVAELIRRF
ncbi:MAG: hypothetical protein Aurels2KO_53470 [Aureliella sp.]